MKAFLAAIVVGIILVLAIKPLRLQAANIGYQMGFLELDCPGFINLVYPPQGSCKYKFNLFGPFEKIMQDKELPPNPPNL